MEDKASQICPVPSTTSNQTTNLICPALTSSTNTTTVLLSPPNYYFPFKATIEIEDGEGDGIDGTNAGLKVCLLK